MFEEKKTEEPKKEETITIVLVKTGPNVRTKQIVFMGDENIKTYTPTSEEVIATEKNNVFIKTGEYPTNFNILTDKTTNVLSQAADAIVEAEVVDKKQPKEYSLGGYRITKRRRNPRRKQKKSYRRRRI